MARCADHVIKGVLTKPLGADEKHEAKPSEGGLVARLQGMSDWEREEFHREMAEISRESDRRYRDEIAGKVALDEERADLLKALPPRSNVLIGDAAFGLLISDHAAEEIREIRRDGKIPGAFHCTPSWFTYTHAGLAPSYCFGTYTVTSRVVPGKIFDPENSNLINSPRGTPGRTTESGCGGNSSRAAGATAAPSRNNSGPEIRRRGMGKTVR